MDLITFDLDETLISAKRCHFLAFNDAFKKFGLKKISYKKLKPLLNGRHAHEIVKILYPKLSKLEVDKIAKEHHKLIATKYGRYAKKIKGAILSLKKIKKKYKIGIATNCTHKEINGLLKGAKINKNLFDIIVGKDDVKKSKPAPDEFIIAGRKTKTKIKYHVGDSPYDIIAGKKAGIKVIAVLTGVNSRKVLSKQKPYKIVKSIRNVPEVIL